MVIHIQDVHQNLDAQKNIGRLVGSLLASQQAGVIALEGTWGDINLQPFRDFPHRQAVKQSADYLLKENTISGPIHAILTGTGPLPPLIGIDDPTHYNANVEAYRQSAPRIAAIKKVLAQAKATLDQEKARVFTSELKTFDMAVEAYREGQSSLGDFVEILTNPRLQLELPSSLRIFQETLAIEKSLNFKEVERERAVLIERLVQKLSRIEMEELTRLSVAYRSSQVSYADFYTYLKGLCLRAGVALKSYPAMDDYIRYVLLADQINAETLLSELTSLERKAFAALAKSPEAQVLIVQSRLSYLTAQLVDFSLTPDEWKEYYSLKDAETINTDYRSFEAFYQEAETRDQAMAENLLKAMGAEQGQSVAILVTGGYHSAGLTAQLTQSGATIISVVPKIEKVETAQGATYLSVFTQEKTPLEKLFVGEKLFLAQNPISQPTRQILAPTLMVLATVFLGQVSGISDLNSLYQSLGGLGTLSDLVSSNGGAVAITLSVGGAIYVVRAIKDKGEDIREFVVDPRSDNGNMFARALIFFKRAFAPLLVSFGPTTGGPANERQIKMGILKQSLNPLELFREQFFVLPAALVTAATAAISLATQTPLLFPLAFLFGLITLAQFERGFVQFHPRENARIFQKTENQYDYFVRLGFWMFGGMTLLSLLSALAGLPGFDAQAMATIFIQHVFGYGLLYHALFNIMSPVKAIAKLTDPSSGGDHLYDEEKVKRLIASFLSRAPEKLRRHLQTLFEARIQFLREPQNYATFERRIRLVGAKMFEGLKEGHFVVDDPLLADAIFLMLVQGSIKGTVWRLSEQSRASIQEAGGDPALLINLFSTKTIQDVMGIITASVVFPEGLLNVALVQETGHDQNDFESDHSLYAIYADQVALAIRKTISVRAPKLPAHHAHQAVLKEIAEKLGEDTYGNLRFSLTGRNVVSLNGGGRSGDCTAPGRVNFWTQGAWNTTLENIEFETYFEGGFFGRFIGLVGMSDNKLTLWIHAIEFSPVARNPGATSSMSASNVQKRLVLESLRFINAFAQRAGINNVELTGISNSVGYVDILPGLLDGLKNDISGPGLRPTSFTLLNSFDGARRVPPLVRPNDKPNAFVSTYLQGWRTPTNFLPETGNEEAPIEAATVPLGRGHVPVRDLDRAAPILMDMIKDVIDDELKSLEALHWEGYQNTIQKALGADDPLSFWETSIRDISDRILRWTEIFDPGAVPSINKILAKANGLGQDKGRKLIERTLINNQALADKVPHVAAFLYRGKKTYSYMKDFSKNHKEVTQREWEQTLAETAIDLNDVALSMRINFPTVEQIFDLWVIYRRDKSRLPLDFESFIAIWLARPNLKEITPEEFDSKLLPLWKGAVLANVNPKSFQLRRSSELTAIYKRLRANLLHFLTFENITGGGVMNVMQKIHPTLQAEFKDRLARSGFDSPEIIELLSLQTTAVITYYLRFKTSREKVGIRSSTIDTFSLSQLTGDGYLKGPSPAKAEGEERNNSTNRHDAGRATSRWMTRLFESVGYLIGGEEGRRKAGDHYRDHAPIYEWTLGVAGMVVNFGVMNFFTGSGLAGIFAPLLGAVFGGLFFASHFGKEPKTPIKVSVPNAAVMAVIYTSLIILTPYPILEFLEYRSFVSVFLLSMVVSWWAGALALHSHFDRKRSPLNREKFNPDLKIKSDEYFWLKNFLQHQYQMDIWKVEPDHMNDESLSGGKSYRVFTQGGGIFVLRKVGETLLSARSFVSSQLNPQPHGEINHSFIRHVPHHDEKLNEDHFIILWEGVRWSLERPIGDVLNKLTKPTNDTGRATSLWGVKLAEVLFGKRVGIERVGAVYKRLAPLVGTGLALATVALVWGGVALLDGSAVAGVVAPLVGAVFGGTFMMSHYVLPNSWLPKSLSRKDISSSNVLTMTILYAASITLSLWGIFNIETVGLMSPQIRAFALLSWPAVLFAHGFIDGWFRPFKKFVNYLSTSPLWRSPLGNVFGLLLVLPSFLFLGEPSLGGSLAIGGASYGAVGFLPFLFGSMVHRDGASSPTAPFGHLTVVANVMDVGSYFHGNSILYERSLPKLKKLLPEYAEMGATEIYLTNGLFTPSEMGKKVHTVPPKSPIFVYARKAISMLGGTYFTKRKWLNGTWFDDRHGSNFSTSDMRVLNPDAFDSTTNTGRWAELAEFVARARQLGMKVKVDLVPWLSPDGITKDNWTWAKYHQKVPEDDRSLPDERILEKHPGNSLVKWEENGESVRVLVGNFSPGVDQVDPDFNNPGYQAYLIDYLHHLIDAGVESVRVDMAHRLNSPLATDGWQDWTKVINDAKDYAKSKSQTFHFLMEAYPEGGPDWRGLFLDRFPQEAVYHADPFHNYERISKGEGEGLLHLKQAMEHARSHPGQWWAFPTNFDEWSLKNMGGPQDAFLALLLTYARLGVPLMVDSRELMGQAGQNIPQAGGQDRDRDGNFRHPFPNVVVRGFYAFWKIFRQSSRRRFLLDMKSFLAEADTIEILDTQNEHRYFAVGIKNKSGTYDVRVWDFYPGWGTPGAWVEAPKSFLTNESVALRWKETDKIRNRRLRNAFVMTDPSLPGGKPP
jgi:hypothetical protein